MTKQNYIKKLSTEIGSLKKDLSVADNDVWYSNRVVNNIKHELEVREDELKKLNNN